MDHPITFLAGLPGQGLHLGLDPLAALFLCLLAPQCLAAAIAGAARSALFWATILAMALTLLAADAFTLILGYGLTSAAVCFGRNQPATPQTGLAIVSGLCLFPAIFLPPGNVSFLFLLLGLAAPAGLAPPHLRLPPAPAPDTTAAILANGAISIALYVLIRYAFTVLAAPALPWWGGLLILAGAAAALLGARAAVLATELQTILAQATTATAGLIVVALGLALRAKTLNNPALAALALQAALLLAIAHALFKPLLLLGTGAVAAATGTTSLDWLGGLMRGMPRLGLLMLLGATGMAALPLGPAFAASFLLFHAAIASAAAGGLAAHFAFPALVAVLGLGTALGLAAALRLIGIGFLGRPRSLRAAAAEEAPRRTLFAMALLAGLCLIPALLPGLLLTLLQPVINQLAADAPPPALQYAPLPLAFLLLATAGAAWALLRRHAARGTRETGAWNGGFGKPPIWLPFGDPSTQPTGTGFAQPIRQILARYLPPLSITPPRLQYLTRRLRHVTTQQRLAILLAVFLAALLAAGLGPS